MAVEAEVAGSRRRLRGGVLAGVVALVLAAGAGGWAARAGGLLGGSGAAPAAAGAEAPTGTATVARTDVVERQQVAGTLGYGASATVVAPPAGAVAGGPPAIGGGGQSQGGVLTRVAVPGAVIGRGQALYEVDGRPVPLWYGARPAWRAFRLGMADGPDVRELEANLVALGDDPERAVTVDGHYSLATVAAVERWQQARGLPRTGTVPLGQVVLLPGPVRVATVSATVGAPLEPGTPILVATSTRPLVTVALDPAYQQLVRRGERVLVTLPDGATTPGTVTTVSRVAVPPGGGTGGAGEGQAQGQSGGNGNGPPQASLPVTIGLADPRAAGGLDQAPVQVAITTQAHRGVLAVPIAALLARPEGGYAVEVVEGGARRRLPVRTGLFDDTAGLVEVAGPGLAEGTRVEVPAP